MNQQSPTTPYEYKANPRWMGNPVVGEMCEKCFSDVCVSPPRMVNRRASTCSSAECAKASSPLGPTTVASVTGQLPTTPNRR